MKTTVTVLISLLRNQLDSSHYWTKSAGNNTDTCTCTCICICRLSSFPGADDLSLFEKFERQHKGSSTHYSSPQLKKKEPVFTVSHYASPVTYSIQVNTPNNSYNTVVVVVVVIYCYCRVSERRTVISCDKM